MARFLTNEDLAMATSNLIKSAGDELLLLSPYLKFSDAVRSLLLERDSVQNARTTVLCRRGKSFERFVPTLQEFKLLEVRTSKALHAKCCISGDEAVLGSMNLHEFSALNNDEMGFSLTRRDDPELFAQVQKTARTWVHRAGVEPLALGAATPKRTSKTKLAGFCIRCGGQIPKDAGKPLCADDYRVWARYEDEKFQEMFCHACGDARDTTFEKPLCRGCYRKEASA